MILIRELLISGVVSRTRTTTSEEPGWLSLSLFIKDNDAYFGIIIICKALETREFFLRYRAAASKVSSMHLFFCVLFCESVFEISFEPLFFLFVSATKEEGSPKGRPNFYKVISAHA